MVIHWNSSDNWKFITINGKKYTRETDTLDTFVNNSSWYYVDFVQQMKILNRLINLN